MVQFEKFKKHLLFSRVSDENRVMGKNKISRLLNWKIFAFIITVPFFQNCSSYSLLDSFTTLGSVNKSQQAESSSGNGQGYDGKITFIYAPINFSCEGKPAPKEVLYYQNSKWLLVENTKERCHNKETVLVSEPEFNISNDLLVFYKSKKYVQAADTLKNQSFKDNFNEYTISIESEAIDEADFNLGDGICKTVSGVCTIRAAIEEANMSPNKVSIIYIPQGKFNLKSTLRINTSNTIAIIGLDNGAELSGDGTFPHIMTNSLEGYASLTNLADRVSYFENLKFTKGASKYSYSEAANVASASGNIVIRNSYFENLNKASEIPSVLGVGNSAKIQIESSQFIGGYKAVETNFFTGLKISNSIFKDTIFSALDLQNTHQILIENISVFENKNHGLRFLGGKGVTVNNSTIHKNGGNGIHLLSSNNYYGDFDFNGITLTENGSLGKKGIDIMVEGWAPINPVFVRIKNSIIGSRGIDSSGNQVKYSVCNLTASRHESLITEFRNSLIMDPGWESNLPTGCGGGIENISHSRFHASNYYLTSNVEFDSISSWLSDLVYVSSSLTPIRMINQLSPAIGLGDKVSCLPKDQVSTTRLGSICDSGSYQYSK